MFKGSLVALVTPMHDDGGIDFVALERLVGWHLENKTDGLVILGTTGESPTIEDSQRKTLLTQVIAQVGGAIPVIVGTGTNNTHHSIELTQQAMELGADAVLLVTPYYNKPTQEGLFHHFRTIAAAVPIPQILYNVPSRTCCDLLPETVALLGKFSNIVALKEATGDIARLEQLLALGCQMDFLTGVDGNVLEFILRGGKGDISVVANVAPRLMHELCRHALEGNRAQAEQCNNKIKALCKTLFLESNPIPVKWALQAMKMIEGGIRLPLTSLNKKFHEELRQSLRYADIDV